MPETVGGRFVLVSLNRAVQYGIPWTKHAFKVHAASPPGTEREQVLQPSYQVLHCGSFAGSSVARQELP
jgi:hypothetical protein